jgi:hypothetical protein
MPRKALASGLKRKHSTSLYPVAGKVDEISKYLYYVYRNLPYLFRLSRYLINGRAMAQAVSRWPVTAETRVRVRVDPCGICGGQSGTRAGFSPSSSVFPVNIIPPLLHIHLSPPYEVCDSSDQTAHYHHLGPKLGTLFLTRYLAGNRIRK